jgi:hypothetical protein
MKPIALSIAETGKLLGGDGDPLSKNTIYRMIARKELDAFKLGARTFITMASIEAIAASAPRLAA